MPDSSDIFFNKLPETDRTFDYLKNTSLPDNKFRNGYFQHIIWLGVGGFIIINHFEPKEIILVDPWLSYKKHNGDHNASSVKRLVNLINWLRKMKGQGYSLAGILVSHEHYDHTDDVELIVKHLYKPAGIYTLRKFNCHIILKHSPVPKNELPAVYCDTGTRDIIDGHANIDHSHLNFHLILDTEGNELYYDDANYNNPGLTAGKPAQPFTVGNFTIEPYVWDHANISNLDRGRILGSRSGHLQRQTAFTVYSNLLPDAKKTLIVNSAGEMSNYFTGDNIMDSAITIDTLIQSIPIPSPLNKYIRKQQMQDIVSYQAKNITINDYIVTSHWESFYSYPAKINRQFKRQRKSRIGKYKSVLKSGKPGEENKVISPGRLYFEFDTIPSRNLMPWK